MEAVSLKQHHNNYYNYYFSLCNIVIRLSHWPRQKPKYLKNSTNDKFNNNNNSQEKLFHEEIIVLDTSVWEVAGSQYNNC